MSLDQIQVYEIIKNNLPLGFSVVDSEGIIIDFNKTAEKITGYAKDEVLGKSHYLILHGTSATEACPLLHLTIRQRKEAVETESFITSKNGDSVNLSVTTFPLIDEKGTFLGGVELFRDVTAIKKMERERTNILSMFAHDMKNPVLTSGGLIARLLSGKAGDLSLKQQEYLMIMEGNLHRVESLIMDFLDFSRIETKEYKPVPVYFDLGSEIQNAIESAKIEADKKSISIRYNPPGEPVMIHADPMMLNRVIANLLGNALKYTDAKGSVTIELVDREKNVLVQVTDTGMGIAEEHLPKIFDAFFRVSRDSSGSGLGLAITKTIIEAHGGRIWVDSSKAGTSFQFILPKKNE
ncbi:MAG: PAS domain-containing sensor histidine kinase [Desulfobulbaceae bacterium]|nr:PAS domain-containing sensor histidine kinase [Desulfobulbaceae bacterium]